MSPLARIIPQTTPHDKNVKVFFMPYADKAKRKEIQRKADEKRKDWRNRSWQCVVYEESAPENWRETLHSHGIAYDISPLHDKDLCADGSPKKPHYHVVLDWGPSARTSGDIAIEIFDSIGGVYPDPLKNRKLFLEKCKVKKLLSAQRYLLHLDEHDPAKVKYDISGVVSGHQELPFSERILKAMEKDELALAMVDYCVDNNIFDFAEFTLRAKVDHPDWMHAIINERPGTFVNRFLHGRMQGVREQRERARFNADAARFEKDTGLKFENVNDVNL